MTNEEHNAIDLEEMAQKLTEFGLSVNQAKVYLCIVQSKITTVNRIAHESQVHRQDIYKIVPKLQKKGLVTKLIGKPVRFQSLPLEKALEGLVYKAKKEAEEKLSRLDANLEIVRNEVRKYQQQGSPTLKDPEFMLLTADAEIRNKFDMSFGNAKKEFSVVTNPILAPRIIGLIRERIKALSKRGVVTRVLIENPSNDIEKSKSLIKSLGKLDGKYLVAKHLPKGLLVPYRIFDGKEVWIILSKETESGQPYFLWTTAPNVVKFYKQNFEKAWKDKTALPL